MLGLKMLQRTGRHGLVAGLLGLAVAACAPTPPADQPQCDAADWAGLKGQNIAATTFPADLNMRIVGPGDVVTQEFVADRVTLRTDENGIILSASCG